MSEWDDYTTPCNFCMLRRMERMAARRGATVRTFRAGSLGVAAQYSDHNEPSAYFMALPERCAC